MIRPLTKNVWESLEPGDQIILSPAFAPLTGPLVSKARKGVVELSFPDNHIGRLIARHNPFAWKDGVGVVTALGVPVDKFSESRIRILRAEEKKVIIKERLTTWQNFEPGDVIIDNIGGIMTVLEKRRGLLVFSFVDEPSRANRGSPYLFDEKTGRVIALGIPEHYSDSAADFERFVRIPAENWKRWPKEKPKLWQSLQPGDVLHHISGHCLGLISVVLARDGNKITLSVHAESAEELPIIPAPGSPYDTAKGQIVDKDRHPVSCYHGWFEVQRGAGIASSNLYRKRLQLQPLSLVLDEEEFWNIIEEHREKVALIAGLMLDREITDRIKAFGHILDFVLGPGNYNKEQLALLLLVLALKPENADCERV